MSTISKAQAAQGAVNFLASIGRNSHSSETTYEVALKHFQRFLDTKKYTNIIKRLRTNKINVYVVLDEFVAFLMEQKNRNDRSMAISNRTIKMYMAAIKSYLAYYDIDIVPAKFKHKVKMPKIYHEKEEAIDVADIREILLHVNNRRLKPYLLCLASGGMRANEATSLRLCDIDFTTSPTKVYVRNTPQHKTKTKTSRFTYISDEASKYLKEWIEYRYRVRRIDKGYKRAPVRNENDLAFANRKVTGYRGIYNKLRIEFAKILTQIDKADRKHGALRRKITLNSFRRFAKTVVSDQASSDFSEWFIGHAESSYWTKKEHEIREIYKTKCMKYLTFLDYTTLEATGKNIEAKLSEKEKEIQLLRHRDQIKDQEMQTMKEQIQTIMNNLEIVDQPSKNKLAKQLIREGMYKPKNNYRSAL